MDVLSEVLRAVRLTGAIFFDVEASAPWVAETPGAAAIVNETTTRCSGGETVLSKVAELMFVDVIRRYVETLPRDARG